MSVLPPFLSSYDMLNGEPCIGNDFLVRLINLGFNGAWNLTEMMKFFFNFAQRPTLLVMVPNAVESSISRYSTDDGPSGSHSARTDLSPHGTNPRLLYPEMPLKTCSTPSSGPSQNALSSCRKISNSIQALNSSMSGARHRISQLLSSLLAWNLLSVNFWWILLALVRRRLRL